MTINPPAFDTEHISPFDRSLVGDVPFCVTTMDEAVAWVVDEAARRHIPVNVRLANAWNVALAHQNADYRRLLAEEGVNFPDGTPVVWCLNFKRRPRRRAGRVRGPSLFVAVMSKGVDSGIRHFLLGGAPQTLTSLQDALTRQHHGLKIVGSYSPPFAPADSAYIKDCAQQIKACQPDLVWVGLGTPKQDVVGTALAKALGVTVLNVGAAFDFASGNVREAPVWIQRSGFEWLFRLLSEPRRLWRRYLIGNFQFVRAVASSWSRRR